MKVLRYRLAAKHLFWRLFAVKYIFEGNDYHRHIVYTTTILVLVLILESALIQF